MELRKNEKFNELTIKISNQNGYARFKATEYEQVAEALLLYRNGEYVGGVDSFSAWTIRECGTVSMKADVDLEKVKDELRPIEETPYT